MKNTFITITDAAHAYLIKGLSKEVGNNIGIRIFVVEAGTPDVECCMAYCPKDNQEPTDKTIKLKGFNIYIAKDSQPYLKGAIIDFSLDNCIGRLTFKIPHLDEKASIDKFAEQYRLGHFKR